MKIHKHGYQTLLLLATLASGQALAQQDGDWENWPHGSRWTIGAGYFAPDLNTRLIVTDEELNVGTGISFEQNLGLDDSKGTGLLNIDWRFASRHTLSYRYFVLDRSASVTNSTITIAVGDDVFDVSLPIQSFFDIAANELSYSYSILFDPKKELFAGLGLSVQDLALGLQGTASSPNPGAIINSTLNSTTPLPTLNLGFNYVFSDRWIFQSRIGWLAVNLDLGADEDLSGEIINSTVGILWNTFDNVGFYAQYNVFDVDVDHVDNGVLFAIDYDYKGPVLGINVTF